MLTESRHNFWRYGLQSLPTLSFLFALSFVVYEFRRQTFIQTNALTLGAVGVVVTAVSIFLAFRMSQAYDRWWEARKLWGALVNTSRNFGRQVVTLLPNVTHDEQHTLIYRHIACVYALRTALLQGPSGAAQGVWEPLRQWLPGADFEALKVHANVPTFLITRQGQSLRELAGADVAAKLTHLQLDRTLSALYDIQGACERIKNTVFPAKITAYTRLFVWLLAIAIPWTVLEANTTHTSVEVGVVTVTAFVFVTIEKLGRELKNPFEGRPSDMPMRALARAIEIDLRQMLGEQDVPAPEKAVNGVLN